MNMQLKRAIAAGAAAIVLVSSTMSVSAAKNPISDYVNALKKNHQENLILDVNAYKAAYSDLEAAFGDDLDAYVEHYLTIGVYEGRTKGVLFDPLVYAEAYSDVKGAFGYNIPAIINHYVTFGITENRTLGTANGYADLAAAERAGAQNTHIQRTIISPDNYNSSAGGSSYGNSSNTTAGTGSNVIGNPNSPAAGIDGSMINNNTPVIGANGNIVNNNAPVTDNNSTPGNSSSNNTSDNSQNSASTGSSSSNPATPSINYHHTTSIYDDDNKTLVRVEYYDDNSKLTHWSEVTNYDSSSNSYTEDIYHYDEANDSYVHDSTDTYVGGELSSSEKH